MDEVKPESVLSSDNTAQPGADEIEVIEKVGAFFTINSLLNTSFDAIDAVYHDNDLRSTSISTGIKKLDDATGGLRPGDLIIVTGATSCGKSSLCQHIARSAALKKKTIAYFTTTNSRHRLCERFILSEAHINALRLELGRFQADDWERMSPSIQKLWDSHIFVHDRCPVTATAMREESATLRDLVGSLDLVIVDDLLFVDETASTSSLQRGTQQLYAAARGLKAMARGLDIPVVVACPTFLSRSQRRTEETANMGDLAGLEDYADLVLLIHRNSRHRNQTSFNPNDEQLETDLVEIEIAKHRNGPEMRCEAVFFPALGRFEDMSTTDDKDPSKN